MNLSSFAEREFDQLELLSHWETAKTAFSKPGGAPAGRCKGREGDLTGGWGWVARGCCIPRQSEFRADGRLEEPLPIPENLGKVFTGDVSKNHDTERFTEYTAET